jgi:hypothetical protein
MKSIIAPSAWSRKIIPCGKIDSYHVRMALGIGALSIEPFVDFYSNKKMDKESRWYSAVKTSAKIIIGTATGVTARYFGQKVGARYFAKFMRKTIVPILKEHNIPALKKVLKNIKIELLEKGHLTQETEMKIVKLFDETGVNKILGKEGIVAQATANLSAPLPNKDKILASVSRTFECDFIYNYDLIKKLQNKLNLQNSHGKAMVKKLIIDPKSVFKDFAKAFGDFTGVLTAAAFTLAIDAPVINQAINYTMSKFFPGYSVSKSPKLVNKNGVKL